MPIFMDRHEMRDLRRSVAEAHRKDLRFKTSTGVKYLTYWYDLKRCTGFCLVEAPDAATAAHVHREAHGEIARKLSRSNSPPSRHSSVASTILGWAGRPGCRNGRWSRAVMVTDIVGSTELTARLGDLPALELVRAHDALVRRGLATHEGREVKHTGDGIMAVFDNVANAVRAAADIQRRFCGYNSEASEDLRVRIGIYAGEPVSDQNDLFGATVQLAFRLCSEAEAVDPGLRSGAGSLRARTDAFRRVRRAALEGISKNRSGFSVRVAERGIICPEHSSKGLPL